MCSGDITGKKKADGSQIQSTAVINRPLIMASIPAKIHYDCPESILILQKVWITI